MSILATLLAGDAIASPVDAIGRALDGLFTSDEERLQAQAVLDKLRQHPAELQVELNKVEARHRSVFVAGWRPFIGWVSGLGLAWAFLGHPVFEWAAALYAPGIEAPAIVTDHLMELVIAMLGLSGLRSFEKLKGRTA